MGAGLWGAARAWTAVSKTKTPSPERAQTMASKHTSHAGPGPRATFSL